MKPSPKSDAGSETASEPEDAQVPSSSPQPKTALPKRGRLGQIGGQPKVTEPEATTSSTQQPPRRRIGAIGKRTNAALVPPEAAEEGRDRTDDKVTANEEKPSETLEDRADRRRLELRMELDKKAAAGPSKKKRKF